MRLLSIFVVAMLVCSCRASFESVREASGISPSAEQDGQSPTAPGSGDATAPDGSQPSGEDLPVGGGEDPNQLPPGGDDTGNGDDDNPGDGNGNDNGGDNDGVTIRIETPFGPGEDPACPNGGKKITEGVDRNGNGQLEDSEITSISYICDDGSEPRCCWCCCDSGGKDDPGQSQDCAQNCCCSSQDDPSQSHTDCTHCTGSTDCCTSGKSSRDPSQSSSGCCCCCEAGK